MFLDDASLKMKFHFDTESLRTGKAKVWFEDPETGEREWVDVDLQELLREKSSKKSPEMPKHCCLPPAM